MTFYPVLVLCASFCFFGCGPLLANQKYDEFKGGLVTSLELPSTQGSNSQGPYVTMNLTHTQGDSWVVLEAKVVPRLVGDPPVGCRTLEWSADGRPVRVLPSRLELIQTRDGPREKLTALMPVSELERLERANRVAWRICTTENNLYYDLLMGVRDFVKKTGSVTPGNQDGGTREEILALLGKSPESPAASPPVEASGRLADSAGEVIAVFDVHDAFGRLDKEVLVQLTVYLGTVLAQTGKYMVVPREQLRRRLIDEKKGSYKTCYDESCQIELGKAVAAQKTLATTIIQVGTKCAVAANLIDLRNETAERGASTETGCEPGELLGAMKEIAAQLSR